MYIVVSKKKLPSGRCPASDSSATFARFTHSNEEPRATFTGDQPFRIDARHWQWILSTSFWDLSPFARKLWHSVKRCATFFPRKRDSSTLNDRVAGSAKPTKIAATFVTSRNLPRRSLASKRLVSAVPPLCYIDSSTLNRLCQLWNAKRGGLVSNCSLWKC